PRTRQTRAGRGLLPLSFDYSSQGWLAACILFVFPEPSAPNGAAQEHQTRAFQRGLGEAGGLEEVYVQICDEIDSRHFPAAQFAVGSEKAMHPCTGRAR